MKFSYYPGCSLHATAAEYDHSTKEVCERLGIQLEEIEGWTCCGASSAHSTSHLLGVAIPAHTIAIAEEKGLDIVAPCAACYQRLVVADYEIKHDPKIREKVCKAIGKDIKGTVKTLSILELFLQYGFDNIANKVVKPLTGLKVASYYGCYLVKPPKIVHADDAENPKSMDNIMTALGAEAVQWPHKTECCGGSLLLSNTDVVHKLGRDILQSAVDAGADCIVTPCPLCQPNLDMQQARVNKRYGTNFNIPIFYFTELMAIALGTHKNSLGLHKHFIDPSEVLKAI